MFPGHVAPASCWRPSVSCVHPKRCRCWSPTCHPCLSNKSPFLGSTRFLCHRLRAVAGLRRAELLFKPTIRPPCPPWGKQTVATHRIAKGKTATTSEGKKMLECSVIGVTLTWMRACASSSPYWAAHPIPKSHFSCGAQVCADRNRGRLFLPLAFHLSTTRKHSVTGLRWAQASRHCPLRILPCRICRHQIHFFSCSIGVGVFKGSWMTVGMLSLSLSLSLSPSRAETSLSFNTKLVRLISYKATRILPFCLRWFFPLRCSNIPNKLPKVLSDYCLIYYEFLYEPCSIASENFSSDLIRSVLINIWHAFYMRLSIEQIWEHEWTSLYNASDNMLSIVVYSDYNL